MLVRSAVFSATDLLAVKPAVSRSKVFAVEQFSYNTGTTPPISNDPVITFTVQTRIFGEEPLFEIDYPADIEEDDLLKLVLATDHTSGANVWPLPDGWILESHEGDGVSDSTLTIMTKIADGTETGTLIMDAGTGQDLAGAMFRSTNSDSLEVVGAAVTANAQAISAPAITTLSDNSIVFAMATYDGGDAGNWAIAGDFTILVELGINAGAGVGLVIATRTQAIAGDTGTADWTIDGGVSDGMLAQQTAIKPFVPRG